MISRAVPAISCSARTLPTSMPLRGKERVGHAAADHQVVHLADEVGQEVELGRHLGAAHDRHQRPLGIAEGRLERMELLGHQAAGAGGQVPGQPLGGGMGAVRGRKRVVTVDVAQLGHALRQRRRRCLPRPAWKRVFSSRTTSPSAIAALAASPTQSSANRTSRPSARLQRGHDLAQGHLRDALALRPAEMGQQDRGAALVEDVASPSARCVRSAWRRSPGRPPPARSDRPASARACRRDPCRRAISSPCLASFGLTAPAHRAIATAAQATRPFARIAGRA